MTTEPTLDRLIEELGGQLEDEKAAFTKYQSLAMVADSLGHSSAGATLRNISEDEQRHFRLLGQMVKQLSWAPGSTELNRPYPQTYGEWADLGADIKETDPDTSEEVNDALTKIAIEAPDADDAKRWLTSKAGELGVT